MSSNYPIPSGATFAALRPTGLLASASFTPAAAAYGAGDIIDAAKEFPFIDRIGELVETGAPLRITAAVTRIGVASVPSGATSFTLHLYNATPPSAQADNDAWTLASGDLAAYLGSIDLGTPADLGGALFVRQGNLSFDAKLVARRLWGRLVTVGAHTPTATAIAVDLHGSVL